LDEGGKTRADFFSSIANMITAAIEHLTSYIKDWAKVGTQMAVEIGIAFGRALPKLLSGIFEGIVDVITGKAAVEDLQEGIERNADALRKEVEIQRKAAAASGDYAEAELLRMQRIKIGHKEALEQAKLHEAYVREFLPLIPGAATLFELGGLGPPVEVPPFPTAIIPTPTGFAEVPLTEIVKPSPEALGGLIEQTNNITINIEAIESGEIISRVADELNESVVETLRGMAR